MCPTALPSLRHGNVIAEVISDGPTAATDVDYEGVTLKTRFNPIRHYVFGGLNYGAQIKVSWKGENVLFIRCADCENLQVGNILERKWQEVTICYDRSNVLDEPIEKSSPCPPASDPISN